MAKILNLSNNDFIRTTEDGITSLLKIFGKLEQSGDIYLDKYSGWYSVSDEAYYDNDEIEEKNESKISKISGSKVEWVGEGLTFLNYLHGKINLLKFYDNPNFILPSSRKNEVVNFVKKGLKDLSVSRTSFT